MQKNQFLQPVGGAMTMAKHLNFKKYVSTVTKYFNFTAIQHCLQLSVGYKMKPGYSWCSLRALLNFILALSFPFISQTSTLRVIVVNDLNFILLTLLCVPHSCSCFPAGSFCCEIVVYYWGYCVCIGWKKKRQINSSCCHSILLHKACVFLILKTKQDFIF